MTEGRAALRVPVACREHRSSCLSFTVGKFTFEQRAQHVGDGLVALKGGDLDPAAHVGGDVNREPGGELGGAVRAQRWTVRRIDPAFWIGRAGRDARKSVVAGKRVDVRVALGGRRCIKKKNTYPILTHPS